MQLAVLPAQVVDAEECEDCPDVTFPDSHVTVSPTRHPVIPASVTFAAKFFDRLLVRRLGPVPPSPFQGARSSSAYKAENQHIP